MLKTLNMDEKYLHETNCQPALHVEASNAAEVPFQRPASTKDKVLLKVNFQGYLFPQGA